MCWFRATVTSTSGDFELMVSAGRFLVGLLVHRGTEALETFATIALDCLALVVRCRLAPRTGGSDDGPGFIVGDLDGRSGESGPSNKRSKDDR